MSRKPQRCTSTLTLDEGGHWGGFLHGRGLLFSIISRRTAITFEINMGATSADSMVLLTSMPPLVAGSPRVLVLGSMPGELSLQRGEYYANPRNRFWSLIQDLLGVPSEARYGQRAAASTAAGIALWDVLKHCRRAGSLDRAIVRTTEVPNDLPAFLRQYGSIVRVVFNGQKAAQSFRRLVTSELGSDVTGRVSIVTAPSTSPANTRIGRAALAEAWRAALS